VQSSVRAFRVSAKCCDEVKVVITPPFADSISEGDMKHIKAVGDSVKEDDIVCEIETDKTSIPVPSPGVGIIEEFLVEDGNKVVAGQQLFKLRLTGSAPAGAASAAPPAASPAPVSPAKSGGSIPSTPPPPPPVPTKPLSSTPTSSVKPSPATDASAAAPVQGARTEQRVKMNRMRLRIAQRLKDAQNTCAMLTTFNEIDMSNAIEMRERYKDAFVKKHGVKFGFMSPFIRAASFALKDQPAVNGVIEGNEIVYRDYVDISVAVATPKGLVVPVLRNVENMNYAEIEKGLSELGEKARKGELAIEDMDGGTFTISNGGVFGSLMGTPIINPPQSAILGMHGIFERPVAIKGEVKVRPMMYVALTYDHRLIDGREAVTFLRKLKAAVEDPRVMFLDI